jgi:hypothetical protein
VGSGEHLLPRRQLVTTTGCDIFRVRLMCSFQDSG